MFVLMLGVYILSVEKFGMQLFATIQVKTEMQLDVTFKYGILHA